MDLNKLVTSGFALLFLIILSSAGFLAGYTHAYNSIRAETVDQDIWMNMDGTCTDCSLECITWQEEWETYQASLTGKE